MIGNGKFEPLTVWNDIELRYRITASQWTSLVIKYLRKNEKGQKKNFEGHVKDQIEKNIFLYFFCPNMIKWLRKFSQCLWFDLQGHKDQKDHKKAEYS